MWGAGRGLIVSSAAIEEFRCRVSGDRRSRLVKQCCLLSSLCLVTALMTSESHLSYFEFAVFAFAAVLHEVQLGVRS